MPVGVNLLKKQNKKNMGEISFQNINISALVYFGNAVYFTLLRSIVFPSKFCEGVTVLQYQMV